VAQRQRRAGVTANFNSELRRIAAKARTGCTRSRAGQIAVNNPRTFAVRLLLEAGWSLMIPKQKTGHSARSAGATLHYGKTDSTFDQTVLAENRPAPIKRVERNEPLPLLPIARTLPVVANTMP
jgi:hypothetical protein